MKFKKFNPQILPFLGLGISTQAPINLIGGLLMLWATSTGLNLKSIGIFAAVTLPYCLKFLWAPFIDRINLPSSKNFGRKKTWCLLWQIGLILGLGFISYLTPKKDVLELFLGCIFIAFCGASQEITVDGLRIDVLKGDDLRKGTVLYQFGNRIGYFMATAGMISLSSILSWKLVYQISILIILIGLISLFFLSEKKESNLPANFQTMVIAPFKDFIMRQNLLILCCFIILYKLCNGILGKMAYSFYYDVGFTKNQIALVSATFGSIITTFGIFLGGYVLKKIRIKSLLFGLGAIEILTSISFAILALSGPNMPIQIEIFLSKIFGIQACGGPNLSLFFIVILFDNIIGGMGGAVWCVYLSTLCSQKFSATQYGFLNALTMVPLTLLGTTSGWLAFNMGWPVFFIFTGTLMIPALLMLKYCDKLFKKKDSI